MGKHIESEAVEPIGGIDLSLARKHLLDAQRAIAAISYSDVWKRIGAIVKCGNASIDTTKGKRGKGLSLQLKVKGKDQSGCDVLVGNLLIDEQLKKYFASDDPAAKKRIMKTLKTAMLRSIYSGWEMKLDDRDD